ncbi:tape measure protein [Caulobacter segnis]|uniref:Tape measure protein N-terminal domain-containing protein n=1 Tax=Caulobacter segnis TaxID=88688 RepID=A0A2W5V6F0_9CAUL|nr:tape measure protein [Caulobacter segnis]PZR32296.1 MAG: hypothetical protein DI526_17125 [Caulobacter segnis]
MSGGADLVARLRLEANAGNTAAVLSAAERQVAGVGTAGSKAAGGLRQAETASADFERSASSAGRASLFFGSALAAIGGRELIGRIKDTALEMGGMSAGLAAVTDGSLGAADAQATIREQAYQLGLVVRQQTEGYLGLAAATNGTSLAGQKTKDIWLGLVQAGTVLNTSQEKQSRALEAIGQLAGKGVVSQEELRQQLAESLPGAYQIAARSMGMTTQAFGKLVDSGKLLSEDFLPRFAAQLQKEFGSKLEAQLTTPLGRARVELAKFENLGDSLSAEAGAAFLDGLVAGVTNLNEALASDQIREAARELGHDLGEALSTAANGAAFLVEHLDEIKTVATAVLGVGLAKWLITSATEARAAAAAYLAKGVAAREAATVAGAASIEEAAAAATLRGAIEAVARAELAQATAAREAALANEQAAAAAFNRARVEASAATGGLLTVSNRSKLAAAERELAIAQTATVAASARAETAAATLAKATTLGGAAAQGAKTLFGGLMGLLGGPWGVALLGAGAAVAYVGKEIAESEARAREAYGTQTQYAASMAQAAEALGDAAINTRVFGADTANAVDPTDKLTSSTRQLTDQTLKLADARRQAALAALQEADQKLQTELSALDKTPARSLVNVQTGVGVDGSPIYGKILASARREQISEERAANMSARIQLAIAKPDPAAKPPKTATVTTSDKDVLRARAKDGDLEAARVAQEEYTRALVAGGVALDDWKVKEAGRLAVERLALADRPKLTAAEQALVAQIRSRAEETERLKIANDRIERSIGLTKSAEADTKALVARSAAALAGEAALEDLQVKEAGLAALQQLGVESLDDLSGKTLDYAKAAVAAAEAKEKQAIATAKVERVAAQIRDLQDRTASEDAYAKALAGGTEALVAYQRQEFVRQELDRAGKTLTADQVAELTKKAEALFAVQAAADSAALDKRQAEELSLARLNNRERAIEERYLQRKSLLLAAHGDLTREEVEARARALALADQAAADDAQAIGDLKESLRRTFIESGKLGFDDVGDYVEQRLREAVFNALLAKPIDILINAVVGSVSGVNGIGAGAGLGQLGGATGLASLFNSAGALAGLTTSATTVATSVLSKLGVSGWNAAKFGGMAGGAIGGAGTGMLVSSVAGLLGLKQSSGNQIGGTIGGALGSFIPIPGGAILGSIAGNLIGGLVGGKPSNQAAVLTLDSSGKVISTDGAKRTEQTTAAAQQIADAVAQIQTALTAGGATLTATVSKIDIGTRDKTHLNFSNGQSIDTAVGDVSAAIETATKTILANAKWATEAQTAYAQKLLAAGATIDQVVASMQVATTFGASLDDAIAQLTDPAAYAKKQALDAIDANYQALKTQAQELIAAGLATTDVLAKIDRLKDLQVDQALKNLASAAGSAAEALDPAAFKRSIEDQIAQLLDPVAYERSKALADIEANSATLKAQAQALVDAGKLSADVLTQLDQLKGLQVADSIKKLGDAAGDTAKALRDAADAQKAAQDFAGSIDDAILQLTDPIAARISAIQRDYETKVAQAQTMIAAGQLGADVLDRLANLRDLQIDDVLSSLAESAQQATDVFADARPRLQSFLDGLAVGSNSPLSAGAQKDAAQATYDRLLGLAQSGNADALSQITSAADALLGADRNATSSASDRLALFNKVTGDIQGLIGRSGGAVLDKPEVVQAKKTVDLLTQLKDSLDPAKIAQRPPAPIEIKASPWVLALQKDAATAQAKSLQDGVDKLAAKSDEAKLAVTEGLARVQAAVSSGLAAMTATLAAGQQETAAAIQGLSADVAANAAEQRMANAYAQRAYAR